MKAMHEINDNTPIVMLTVGQLKAILGIAALPALIEKSPTMSDLLSSCTDENRVFWDDKYTCGGHKTQFGFVSTRLKSALYQLLGGMEPEHEDTPIAEFDRRELRKCRNCGNKTVHNFDDIVDRLK